MTLTTLCATATVYSKPRVHALRVLPKQLPQSTERSASSRSAQRYRVYV